MFACLEIFICSPGLQILDFISQSVKIHTKYVYLKLFVLLLYYIITNKHQTRKMCHLVPLLILSDDVIVIVVRFSSYALCIMYITF